MLARTYYDFRSRLQEEGVILSYSGYVSEAILSALAEALKKKLAVDEADLNVTKRLFSVFVEQVQNIIRYSGERLEGPDEVGKARLGAGLIMVGAHDERFFVVCANAMNSARAPGLRQRLEQLSGLDPAEIRALYREKLRDPPEEESQGATIGLIEIARRSSRPIQFDFLELDADTSFFCMKAYV
jgi:hypothetical protein